MQIDFTHGPIRKNLLLFSIPLIGGNLLQQLYNVVDTWIVGRYLGNIPLAAVGSAFSLMILLNSLLLGLCMGSGVVFSQLYGEGKIDRMKQAIVNAFCVGFSASILLLLIVYPTLPIIGSLMQVPQEVLPAFQEYLTIIFIGIPFTFLFNFCAAVLRGIGNSFAPLLFLVVSTIGNILLDFLFVLVFQQGVAGAAIATVIAQGISAIGIAGYIFLCLPQLHLNRSHIQIEKQLLGRILSVSLLTSFQQSIMNFGILMVQSLINSFGIATMAAFAAGVKIDAFAYSPAQDFANGFSTFVAQNIGANKHQRVKQGFHIAATLSLSFCIIISIVVFVFARPLLTLFIDPQEREAVKLGVQYLRMEGIFYFGIGLLFLLYATYRGLERAGMSIVLTIISLGLRVLISYCFAPRFGVWVVWISIPIGWFAADFIGLFGLRGLFHKKDTPPSL